MGFNVKQWHDFIIQVAQKVQDIYDAIIEQDIRTIKYYCTADTLIRKEMRKKYIVIPSDIDMNYLYKELENKINYKGVCVKW